MGMSASQARLLTITGRLHDNEYEAQSIEAQKIALATQQDKIYQEYENALSANALKVKFMDGTNSNFVTANYDTVCNYSECRPKNYVLVDNRTGKLLVDKEMAEAYKNYRNDKYAFAYAMMGVTPDEDIMSGLYPSDNTDNEGGEQTTESGHWETRTVTVPGEEHTYTYYTGSIQAQIYLEDHRNADEEVQGSRQPYNKEFSVNDKFMSSEDCVRAFYDEIYSRPGDTCDWQVDDTTIVINLKPETVTEKDPDTTTTEEIWVADTPETPSGNADEPSTTETKSFADVFDELAAACGKEELEFSNSQFQFYCQKWEAIDEAGGCTVLEEQYQSGEDGAEWFQQAIESGDIIIRGYNENGSENGWSDTNFATSTNANFLQEVRDTTKEKLAEAKYESALNEINKKDTQFDTELKKLETERNSLTTEMEGIKKVISDNIEKSVNIFS